MNERPKQPHSWPLRLARFLRGLLRAMLYLLAAAALFFAVLHFLHWYEDLRAAQRNEEIADLFGPSQQEPVASRPEEMPDDPQTPNEPQPDPHFAPLLAINPDTVGWLENGDAALHFPVLQRDDNSYYLTHNFYGEESSHGALFLDWRSDPDFPDDNLVIYGHNLGRDGMLHILESYRDPAYYIEHPVLNFSLVYPAEEDRYLIFSVFLSSTKPEHGVDFDYHNKLVFSNNSDWQDYLDEATARSLLSTPVDVQPGDELLTLSTCTYDFSDARLVVMARKLREGETVESFDWEQTTRNSNAKMPAIWNELYGG